jgi:hypothetical protein
MIPVRQFVSHSAADALSTSLPTKRAKRIYIYSFYVDILDVYWKITCLTQSHHGHLVATNPKPFVYDRFKPARGRA